MPVYDGVLPTTETDLSRQCNDDTPHSVYRTLKSNEANDDEQLLDEAAAASNGQGKQYGSTGQGNTESLETEQYAVNAVFWQRAWKVLKAAALLPTYGAVSGAQNCMV